MNSYDQLSFESYPSPERHPDRFALLGRAFGLECAPASSCRFLEIACSTGSSLLPLAWSYPCSEFVGVDPSEKQIAIAKERAVLLGLNNISFRCAKIQDIGSEDTSFDYVLCHGLFSWVSAEEQTALLRSIKSNLKESGIAYVSYNVLPGWETRGELRAELLSLDDAAKSIDQRIRTAREFLKSKRASIYAQLDHKSLSMKEEIDACLKRSDSFIFHELLNDRAEPLYFTEFMKHAGEAGLDFLAEAQPKRMHPSNLPMFTLSTQAKESVKPSLTPLQREQSIDGQSALSLRGTLLCHHSAARDPKVDVEFMRKLFVSSALVPEVDKPDIHSREAVVFHSPSGFAFHVTEPEVKAALLYLRATWPVPVPFPEVAAYSHQLLSGTGASTLSESQEETIACSFFEMFKKSRIDLCMEELAISGHLGETPKVSPVVRQEVEHRDWVTTLRHEYFPLDPLSKVVLSSLTGECSVAEVVQKCMDALHSRSIYPKVDGDEVRDPEMLQKILIEEVHRALLEFVEHALIVEERK